MQMLTYKSFNGLGGSGNPAVDMWISLQLNLIRVRHSQVPKACLVCFWREFAHSWVFFYFDLLYNFDYIHLFDV